MSTARVERIQGGSSRHETGNSRTDGTDGRDWASQILRTRRDKLRFIGESDWFTPSYQSIAEVRVLVIKSKGGSDVLMELAVDTPQGVQLSGANLTGADLSGMDFTGARFKSCNFTDADCRFAKFTNATFQNCVLKRANFAEAVIAGADMSDAMLDGAVLLSVNGARVLLRHCKANGADFTGANLSESDCSFAELRGIFSGANLKNSNLYSVDFTGADLSKADLREADMTGAKIARADFTYAKLQGSIGTNGKPWGFTSRKSEKKPWWQVWRAAI